MIKVNLLARVQELKSRFKTLEPEIAAVSCSYFVGVNSDQSKLGSFFLKCDRISFKTIKTIQTGFLSSWNMIRISFLKTRSIINDGVRPILYIPMKRWMATFEGCISSLRSVQDREAGGWSPNFQFKPKLTSNRSQAFTYFTFTLRTKCVLWYFGKFFFVVLYHLKQLFVQGAREKIADMGVCQFLAPLVSLIINQSFLINSIC